MLDWISQASAAGSKHRLEVQTQRPGKAGLFISTYAPVIQLLLEYHHIHIHHTYCSKTAGGQIGNPLACASLTCPSVDGSTSIYVTGNPVGEVTEDTY